MGASVPSTNPRWFGFNLLEYFSVDPIWMTFFPCRNDGQFLKNDFRWISDWGFTYVRLPMDYLFWSDQRDPFVIREQPVERIDRAIRLGEQYGLHVSLNMHRAPGFCILDTTPVSLLWKLAREPYNLLNDATARAAFCRHWAYFAERYRGIPGERLSFDLVNEPVAPAGRSADYVDVVRAAAAAIRQHDPARWIVANGLEVGNQPVAELADLAVIQSCRGYMPADLTHYRCPWGGQRGRVPTWPLVDEQSDVVYDRAHLDTHFDRWHHMAQRGVPIHCGECGCYVRTPHAVMLRWMSDLLDTLRSRSIGWALWNFRGPFGILDTGRADAALEQWHGHSLDRALLDLLQAMQWPAPAMNTCR
jgi:endoglucanase